jgi:uncharacterized cupredoxin-like copper-binding protein
MRLHRRSATLALLPLAALAALATVALPGTLATPAGASSKTATIKAVETDFHIALSKKSFSPGKYTFDAVNKGHTTHALEITGPGLSNAKTANINPGQSAKLTVTFKKGKYDIFCPIPGHKMLGMNVSLVVASSGGTSSSSKGSGSSSSGGGAGF